MRTATNLYEKHSWPLQRYAYTAVQQDRQSPVRVKLYVVEPEVVFVWAEAVPKRHNAAANTMA